MVSGVDALQSPKLGKRTLTFPDGSSYVGEMDSDGRLNGQGTWDSGRGDSFVGDFINDDFARGCYTDAEGETSRGVRGYRLNCRSCKFLVSGVAVRKTLATVQRVSISKIGRLVFRSSSCVGLAQLTAGLNLGAANPTGLGCDMCRQQVRGEV